MFAILENLRSRPWTMSRWIRSPWSVESVGAFANAVWPAESRPERIKKQTNDVLRQSLLAYSFARSGVFALESWLGPAIELVVQRKRPRLPTDNPVAFRSVRLALEELIRRDVDNIMMGVYPIEVLKPEVPSAHLARMPKLLKEGIAISRRRQRNGTHEFSSGSEALMQGLPAYYTRNFHFQGDGYLSDTSADLYEHQVDILFAGASDAMRRMIIAPLRAKFGYGDGEGLNFLEIAAGTGRATRFVRLAYPKAKIVLVDLSGPYLKRAQVELREFARHDFIEAAAEALPFQDQFFDAVYSIFLFHELPQLTREQVMTESIRVLKPNGFIGAVDSLQLDDRPELNEPLKQFPLQFHEPFYRNYIENKVEDLFAKVRLQKIESSLGFLSKAVWAESTANRLDAND